MQPRQLEHFLAVAEHGSFTAAARARFVAQPSLSQTIRLLEQDLGVELFQRLPGGVRLTPAGEALVPVARSALREFDRVRQHMTEVKGVLTGRLDLVSLPALTMTPVAPATSRFRAAHPGVTVRILHAADAPEAIGIVRQGHAELGFIDVAVEDQDLEAESLPAQGLCLVSPPGWEPPRPATLAAIAGLPLVTSLTSAFLRSRLRLPRDAVVVEVDNRESMVHLILAGAGHGVLPAPLADLAVREGATSTPLDPPLTRPITVVRPAGAGLSPAAGRFLAAIRQEVA
ncbi:LysR family transcriptional regulator [Ammonicoccus fulvus]|uniref:LysR family transcriptional regulator n=1 Tax=Ammonicoccus fulvus TaxID=3138240 RepID=A0ABZ3FM44_9ACTN